MDSAPPLLAARALTKAFPGVKALDRVDFQIERGEVLAFIGENGAGKSTLMKILAGIQRPDSGVVEWDGRPVQLDSTRTAMKLGIALIHQELNLADNLDVAANLFLGREPRRSLGRFDRRAMHRSALELLGRVGLETSPDTLVADLSPGRQQLVEIAKALSCDARLLIMDEPTSSLSARESEQLLAVVDDLRRRGVSIVYITHRLSEAQRIADRVSALRDGRNAGELARDEISHERMIGLMIGRELDTIYAHEPAPAGDVVLATRGLVTSEFPGCEIDLELRAGEIVGVAGLVGAGRTALMRTLFGVDAKIGGEIAVRGRVVDVTSPSVAIQAGIALVPEDRKHHGLIQELAIRDNVSLAVASRDSRRGMRNAASEKAVAAHAIAELAIRTPSDRMSVRQLSGGNQQKVVLGKWLATEPAVLLLDEPTRGVDVGSKEEIYRLMETLAKRGVAVLFVSSDMEEILALSDRTLVMCEGRLSGELQRAELSEDAVMRLATQRDS